eukprot:53384_1
MSLSTKRRDATTTLKVINALSCWTTKETMVKISIVSIVTPVIYWSVDLLTSPIDSARMNIKLLTKDHGYRISTILASSYLSSYIQHLFVWILSYNAIGYKIPKSIKEIGWKIPATIAFNWGVSEIVFTLFHISLHKIPFFAKTHLFHHCVKWPGMTPTILFHPIDLALELGAAVGTMLFTYRYVNKCKLSLILSTSLLYTWYASSHDETRSHHHHVSHHQSINGEYTVYVPYNFGTKGELIRNYVKQNK